MYSAIMINCCLLADRGDSSPDKNIWKERFEFYRSAQPKSEAEEDQMMRRALEESQKLEEERQQRILKQTTSRIHQMYAFSIFFIFTRR